MGEGKGRAMPTSDERLEPVSFGDERLPARFWEKVTPCPDTGCWRWTGMSDAKGYGLLLNLSTRRKMRAHRLSYSTLVGPIGAGLVMDHLCRVPACVNPAHLEPVTSQENTLRGISRETKTRLAALRTSCRYGHPYDAANTRGAVRVVNGNDRTIRICRACARDAARRYRLGVDPLATLAHNLAVAGALCSSFALGWDGRIRYSIDGWDVWMPNVAGKAAP